MRENTLAWREISHDSRLANLKNGASRLRRKLRSGLLLALFNFSLLS